MRAACGDSAGSHGSQGCGMGGGGAGAVVMAASTRCLTPAWAADVLTPLLSTSLPFLLLSPQGSDVISTSAL
jgi:hypothetical protein